MTYEDKKALIKKKKGCAICLRIGHHAKACKIFVKCLICSRRHSTVMCPDLNRTDKKEDTKNEPEISNASASMSSSQVNTGTMLQTLIVNIVTRGNVKTPVRALIDSGAQRSYIKKQLAEKIGLQPEGELPLAHQVFGGIEKKIRRHKIYKICVENLDGTYKLNMTTLDEPKICGSIPSTSHSLGQKLKCLNIDITDQGDITDIGLLIGADFLSYIVTGTFVQIKEGLVAIKTKLGWTIQGNESNTYCSTIGSNMNTSSVLFSKTEVSLTDLWDLETIGIKDSPENISEEEILENFRANLLVNEEGRYEVALPWKHDRSVLCSNKELAEKRLLSTTKRLNSINKFPDYDKVLQEWLQLGIIEIVEPDNGNGHYLAHHAVIKEASLTTKIRPVFDASAKGKQSKYSLNSCLEKGVNLIELIPKLIIRFRLYAVGISSDIAKAFLNISLVEHDRKYLKFLWWKDNSQKEKITFRHCRVVFGLTCSPFLLAGTIKYHLETYNGEMKNTAQRLLECFYTDNCVTSLEEEEVPMFVTEARKIMALGKFDLRSWVTAPMANVKPNHDIVSVLGLHWNTVTDEISCNVSNLKDVSNQKVTKRSLLSIAHSLSQLTFWL